MGPVAASLRLKELNDNPYNMVSPLMSIIVPVYNAEKTLCRCVDSILLQTFDDYELLLIDDGSTDKSAEICDAYKLQDVRVRVFHKKNGGVSSARNLGIRESLSLYISFVDSDDYVEKDYLSSLWMVTGDLKACYFYGDGCVGGDDLFIDTSDKCSLDKLFLTNYVYTPWGKLFKRDIIVSNHILFDERLHLAEDTLFVWEYISRCKSVGTSSYCGYYYTGIWGGDKRKYCIDLKELEHRKRRLYDMLLRMDLKKAIARNLISDIQEIKEYFVVGPVWKGECLIAILSDNCLMDVKYFDSSVFNKFIYVCIKKRFFKLVSFTLIVYSLTYKSWIYRFLTGE